MLPCSLLILFIELYYVFLFGLKSISCIESKALIHITYFDIFSYLYKHSRNKYISLSSDISTLLYLLHLA